MTVRATSENGPASILFSSQIDDLFFRPTHTEKLQRTFKLNKDK
jgi:hypothetical protein